MSLEVWFDFGNTRGKFWLTDGEGVLARAVVAHQGRPAEEVLAGLPDIFDVRPARVGGASVLGADQNRDIERACLQKWGVSPEFASSQGAHGGVISAYRADSGKLGVDRWLGLLAIGDGAERTCIVSCGTAITVDVIEAGKHSGGYIVPGLRLMHDALRSGSALVRWETTGLRSLNPGVNTAEAVEHGVLLMAVSFIDQVARRESPARLVLTGGDAPLVSKFIGRPHEVEPELILKGLRAFFGEKQTI